MVSTTSTQEETLCEASLLQSLDLLEEYVQLNAILLFHFTKLKDQNDQTWCDKLSPSGCLWAVLHSGHVDWCY